MANRAKRNTSEVMMAQRILIDNCLNNPAITPVLARYGYDLAALKAGADKLNLLEAAVATQSAEYGQQVAATGALERAWENAKLVYADTLALARVVFKNDLEAQRTLRLIGDRKNSLSGWLEDAKVFYSKLLAKPEWVKAMERYNRDAKTLAEEQALVDEVDRLKSVQEKEKGEAKGATEARDKLLDDTNEWFSDLREVVKVAFSRDKQKLEHLGMVVLNKPRAKKKDAPTA